jgi:hypothetical protein
MSDPIDRIREAHRKNSAAGNVYSTLRADDIQYLLDRLDAAERENERLREDAERYRWLRGDACPDHSVRWTQWEVRCWVAPFWSGDLRREGLDRSIDAAMAAERGKE